MSMKTNTNTNTNRIDESVANKTSEYSPSLEEQYLPKTFNINYWFSYIRHLYITGEVSKNLFSDIEENNIININLGYIILKSDNIIE